MVSSRFGRTSITDTSLLAPMRGGVCSIPVLLVVGTAADAGAASGERVIRLEASLDIGRRPGGSGPSADPHLVIDDRRVSSQHARITRTPAHFEISDLGSTNGTLVDGRRVQAPTRLRDGALVFIGGWAAVFRLLPEELLDAINEDLALPLGPVGTASPTLAASVRKLRRLARTSEEVLLVGETGVGKEVYARAIHRESGRHGRFVALNCAAIPTELVESEVFGFARGAHSQANTSKPGLIELAAGGTLFLDEIGEMPSVAQAKLLRFLQEREFTPLGAVSPRRVDVRVVAATRQADPADDAPGVRADLLGRLGAEPISLPPLRARPEDVGALARHFLESTRVLPFECAAFLALCLHLWPRNVRELEKVIREAVIYSEGKEEIALHDLPSTLSARLAPVLDPAMASPSPRRRPRPAPSRSELEALLSHHQGNVAHVARALDRQWAVVWRWINRHQIDVERFRG
jgi:transcriptional regulator with AAA-type ATPase domain